MCRDWIFAPNFGCRSLNNSFQSLDYPTFINSDSNQHLTRDVHLLHKTIGCCLSHSLPQQPEFWCTVTSSFIMNGDSEALAFNDNLGESIPSDTPHVWPIFFDTMIYQDTDFTQGRQCIPPHMEVQCGIRRGPEMGRRQDANGLSQVTLTVHLYESSHF